MKQTTSNQQPETLELATLPKEPMPVAALTLKFAAKEWPNVDFFLVWKDGCQFRQQKVLP
jgi:hypothetical protein